MINASQFKTLTSLSAVKLPHAWHAEVTRACRMGCGVRGQPERAHRGGLPEINIDAIRAGVRLSPPPLIPDRADCWRLCGRVQLNLPDVDCSWQHSRAPSLPPHFPRPPMQPGVTFLRCMWVVRRFRGLWQPGELARRRPFRGGPGGPGGALPRASHSYIPPVAPPSQTHSSVCCAADFCSGLRRARRRTRR